MAAAIAAGVLFLALIVAGVMVFRITTDTGTIVIETNDPDVQVVVKQGGNQVTILDGKTNKQIELKSGEYELQLAKGADGLQLSTDRLVLKRGEKEIVRIRRETAVTSKLPEPEKSIPKEPDKVETKKPDTTIPKQEPEKIPPIKKPEKIVPIKDLDKVITNSIGMKLVLIPAGKFVMGSPDSDMYRSPDETPQHEVEITQPFYMGVYLVTVGQFRQFVKDSVYQTEAEKDGKGGRGYNADETKIFAEGKNYNWQNVGWEQSEEHPVVNVTWNDVVNFCEWLSNKDGKKYRLPTEAEWEYSCRAGTKTRFYSGDGEQTLKGVANIADASLKQKYPQVRLAVAWDDGYPFTAPVGKFKPNAFGLYDMHGNVCEWCQDLYDINYYKNSPREVLRGLSRLSPGVGSFAAGAGLSSRDCRSAYRISFEPHVRFNNLGFRVAAVPSGD